jgi:hypothetical protein
LALAQGPGPVLEPVLEAGAEPERLLRVLERERPLFCGNIPKKPAPKIAEGLIKKYIFSLGFLLSF